jgi:hypothetical protein
MTIGMMLTLPSEVFVDAPKVSFIKKINGVVSVLMNVCLVSILQKTQKPKYVESVTITVVNVGDLPLTNVTFVLHGPLWSRVKTVCVLNNAQMGIEWLVLTQLHLTLNSVRKINSLQVVSILKKMLLIHSVLVLTVLPVVDLLKTNA